MARGGPRDMTKHKCKDGEIRGIRAVYFRETDPETGKQRYIREAWFCGHCGYGDFTPFEGKNDGNDTKS
jgi:hypothetical protein